MRRHHLLALVVLVACGKARKPDEDWSRTPFKTIDSSTGGVQFSLSVPENWEPRKPPEGGWGLETGEASQRPSVTVQNVSQDLATSLESAIVAAGAKPENVVRKEDKPNGYHLTETHDETLIRATVFLKVGGSFLWCTATQANDRGIPGFEHTKQALVKICESLVVK